MKNKKMVLMMPALAAVFGLTLAGCASVHAIKQNGEAVEAAFKSRQTVEIEGVEYSYKDRPAVPAPPQKPAEPRRPTPPRAPQIGGPGSDDNTKMYRYNDEMAAYTDAMARYQVYLAQYPQLVAQYNKDIAEYQANLPKYKADVEAKIKAIQNSINPKAPSDWEKYVEGKYLLYAGKLKK